MEFKSKISKILHAFGIETSHSERIVFRSIGDGCEYCSIEFTDSKLKNNKCPVCNCDVKRLDCMSLKCNARNYDMCIDDPISLLYLLLLIESHSNITFYYKHGELLANNANDDILSILGDIDKILISIIVNVVPEAIDKTVGSVMTISKIVKLMMINS